MTEPTSAEVLALPMSSNDANAKTVGDYLITLLRMVWSEGEGFSGKRPFGDSGWEWDLYSPLVLSGYISGEVDEDGLVIDVPKESRKQAETLIDSAIKSLWPR